MATVTIKISSRSKKAKYLLGLITELAKTDSGIEVIDQPYNPEFVKKIEKSRKSKGKAIKTDDLWK